MVVAVKVTGGSFLFMSSETNGLPEFQASPISNVISCTCINLD